MRFSMRDVLGSVADLISGADGDDNQTANVNGSDSNAVSSSIALGSKASDPLLNVPGILNPLAGGLLPGSESSTTSRDEPTQAQATKSPASSDAPTTQTSNAAGPKVTSSEPTPQAPSITPSTSAESDPGSLTNVSPEPTNPPTTPLVPLLTSNPQSTTSTSSSTPKGVNKISTPGPRPTTFIRSTTTTLAKSSSTRSNLSEPSDPVSLSQNQSTSSAAAAHKTMVIGIAVGVSVFVILLGAALFTLHRVFRRRRVGRRAESPPPSPLMNNPMEFSRSSSPSSYLETRAPGITGIMGGRAKAGGVVLPRDF